MITGTRNPTNDQVGQREGPRVFVRITRWEKLFKVYMIWYRLFIIFNLNVIFFNIGYANCSDVFPIYIGDDRTDEDAFKVTPVC